MRGLRTNEKKARLAGFFVVLVLHGALLYSLWHYRTLSPPAAAKTLFVEFLKAPSKSEPPKPEPPKPRPPRVKLEKPNQPPPPQKLVAQTSVELPSEPVAPPPPPVSPRIEAPAEPAPPPPRAQGPVVLDGDLAIACPGRTPPSYPSFSRRMGEEGKSILRVELDETGQVDRATIKTSSGYARLDEAALAAVKRWHCNSAKRDGAAVRAVAIQPFNFVLEGR